MPHSMGTTVTVWVLRAGRGDPLTVGMFKLPQPSRPTTFTPRNSDTREVYNKRDLLTIATEHYNHNT